MSKHTPEYQKQWKAKNPEKRREYERRWHAKNPHKAAEYSRRAYTKKRHTIPIILKCIRDRAVRKGIPFNLTAEDIVVPEFCPALGIKLERSTGCATDASPSVDRIKPELGYVKGNIVVISKRANTIKTNATADEIARVADWLRKIEA